MENDVAEIEADELIEVHGKLISTKKIRESLIMRMKDVARLMLRDAENLDKTILEDCWGSESDLPGHHAHEDVLIMTWSYNGFEIRFDMREEFLR